jgi:hypothetical protein
MKCKICGNKVNIIEVIKKPIYYYCKECELIFMDESFYLSSEEEKLRYTKHNNSITDDGYVNMFLNFIDEAVKPFVKKGDALDFGCGPGPVLSKLLKENNFETDIYDPYFFPDRVYLGKKYDLIACTEVIEHTKNPLYVFNFFSNYLKTRGKLALMTLFHSGVESFVDWWYRQDSTHICFFSLKTFQYLAESNYYKIIYENGKNTLTMGKFE